MWSKIIYTGNRGTVQELPSEDDIYRESFTGPVAKGIYEDMHRMSLSIKLTDSFSEDFRTLDEAEKLFWYDFAEEIPAKFAKLKLFIRPFEDFCRTCIITDREIDAFVQMDLEKYCKSHPPSFPKWENIVHSPVVNVSPITSDNNSSVDWEHLFLELNYLVPLQLKKIGYEIIRHEEAIEINLPMIKKLARTIHSRYLHEVRTQISMGDDEHNKFFYYSTGDSRNIYASEFDDLPEEIKYSNI